MTVVTIAGKPRTIMASSYFDFNKEQLLQNKHLFTWEGDSEEQIEEKVSQLVDNLIYGLKPDHSTNFYHFDDTVRISVKPRGKSRILNRNLLSRLTVRKDKELYATLTEDLVDWYEEYNTTLCSVINAETFTAKVNEIAKKLKINLPIEISFDYGYGVLSASDTSLVIGLPSAVLATMESNPLFAEKTEEEGMNQLIENEVAIVASWLQSIADNGIAAAVTKSNFTRKYGVATNELSVQLDKIINHKMPTVAKKLRKGSNIYKGVTAAGTKYVTVLEVTPLTEEQANSYEPSALAVIDNPNPTKEEKEGGMTKYGIYFKLRPIARTTDLENEAVKADLETITLADVVGTIQ